MASSTAYSGATPEYMEKETAEKLKPFIRRPIVYIWKEGGFSIDS